MIKITSLFSGSKGNCALIQSEKTNILLDIGFGYKPILAKLRARGLSPKDIDAIVITHEHSDHISALPFWTKYCPTNVYAPAQIADLICQRAYCSEVIPVSDEFTVGDVRVEPYVCSHDAVCCLGYRFTSDGDSFASVTDTGCWTGELVKFLSACRTVQLESNHDVDMLSKGSYPYPLKRRILSDFGHLSNDQADEIVKQLVGSRVRNIILSHLSENNNTKELAFSGAVRAISEAGAVEGKDINVYVATQGGLEVTIA